MRLTTHLLALGLLAAGAAPAAEEVCVVAPHLQPSSAGEATARVPFGDPTLFAAGGLEEVQVERDGQLLWERQARAFEPIEGPIPWPLAPIRPGETVILRLRPRGAGAGAFASILLTGAPAAEMARASSLRRRLGPRPAAWLTAVRDAIDRGDLALGLGLLFAFDGPSAPDLNALRQEVFRQACDG